METLAYILSIAGLVTFIISFLVKGANMKGILILSVLGNLLMGASYVFTENLNGALSSFVAMAVCIINYFFAKAQKKIPLWLLGVYAVAFVSVNLMVFTSWVDLVAIAATLAAVLMISAPNGKIYRIWSMSNDMLWTLFDVLRGSYAPLLTHGVLTGFTLVGMLMHDYGKKKKNK